MTNTPCALTIVSAEIKPIQLDFRLSVTHSIASRKFSENIIVELHSDTDIAGFGESIPRAYVTGETTESVIGFLDVLLPQVKEQSFSSPGEVVAFIQELGVKPECIRNHAALCALELALLDLAGKYWNTPVSDIVGLEKNERTLIYSLVIPFLDDAIHESFLLQAKAFCFKHAKIKVDGINPALRVKQAQEILGNDVEFRVDANASWNRENAPGFMNELVELGVVSVEQPLPAEDIEGCAALRRENLMYITLDESVSSVADIHHIASLGACDVINIRISKCGGLIGAMNMIDMALKNDLKVQLGAQVGESCILSAAGAHLASGTPAFLWLEGCFGTHLLKQDLCSHELQFSVGGVLSPPQGPGLGIDINRQLV